MGNNRFGGVVRGDVNAIPNAQKNYTAILEFEIIKPNNFQEKLGERLVLSNFGEYTKKESLMGYSLDELVLHPERFRPKVICQEGVVIELNYDSSF